MRTVGRLWIALLAFVMLSYVLAAPAEAGATFGTVRGGGGAKLSLDSAKSWLALSSQPIPVLDGIQIRTGSGGANLTLDDGSTLRVLPFSAVAFREKAGASELSLAYGRMTFRLPEQTRLTILTPSARLEPVRKQRMVGEVFASKTELMGLKMTRGTLEVRPLAETGRVILASLEPVFLPSRPPAPGAFFSSDVPAAPPAGARGIYTPEGRSLGYLADGKLVISPGFTEDLTRPFSPKLVSMARGMVPQQHRAEEAVTLFDVNGGYVGYLAGPTFYGQAGAVGDQPAPTGIRRGGIASIAAGSIASVGLGFAGGGGTWKKNNDDDDDDGSLTKKAKKMKRATPKKPKKSKKK